jgi:hypothetical protein
VEIAFVDQGYSGEEPAAAAAAHGIRLEVVKLAEAIAQRSPGDGVDGP